MSTEERSAWSISAYSTSTAVTPSRPETLELTSVAYLAPERAGGGGEGDLVGDRAVRRHLDVPDHAEIHDRDPKLGVEDAREHAAYVFTRGCAHTE